MKCEFCEHDNDSNAKFCGKCGAEIAQKEETAPNEETTQNNESENQGEITQSSEPENQTEQDNTTANEATEGTVSITKNIPIKKILMFAIPVVIIVIGLIVTLQVLKGASVSYIKNSITFFSADGEVVVSGNNNAKFIIEGEMYSSQSNLDGSKAALLTDYSGSSGGTLWYITASDKFKIAEDVYGYQMADSGKGVAFFTEYDSKSSTAALHLYDASGKKSSKIAEDAAFLGYSSLGLCISPNGKSVGYISDYESSDDFSGYIKTNGKSAEKIRNNAFALAIADNGKYVYYARQDAEDYSVSLYVKKGNNDVKLVPDMSSFSSSIFLNKDYSQIVFSSDDKAYISRNGKEKEKLTNSEINFFVTPINTQVTYAYGDMGGVVTYGIRTFANTAIHTDDGIFYVDNKFEASKIYNGSIYRYSNISNDGRNLVFIDSSDRLSSVDMRKPNSEKKVLEKSVVNFVASKSGSIIYYVNSDEELWCIKGNGKPTKISDDVSPNYLALPANPNKLFFLMDYRLNKGTLYYTNNGGKKSKVQGGEDVNRIWATNTSVFCAISGDSKDGTVDIFRSNGNEKFTLFQESANY